MIVIRLRDVAVRHPLSVDAGLAALVAAANVPAALAAGGGATDWPWFASVFLPLVWRRRYPIVVFWTVFVVAVSVWAAGIAAVYPFFAILVAVYTLARHRSLRQCWPPGAAVAVLLVVTWQEGDPADLGTLAAALAAAGLLGITLRTRRAYVAELEERARRLERDRDQHAMLAAAAERARIAREMHDIVAHNLAVMVALADGAALTATAAPRRAADTLTTISATGRQALDEMQRLLGVLRDGGSAEPDRLGLSPQPGLDDLAQLVEHVREAGLRATLACEGTPGRWGPGAGLTIYRLVQEALTNTLKHAGPAATAQIRLRYTSTSAEIEITDDGAHRRAQVPAGPLVAGRGLTGAMERVAAYDGRVEAGPLPGAGWRVQATLYFGPGEEGT